MNAKEERRRRLEFLLRLSRKYRGWTQKQLAEALGRDQTKICPESGNPKVDFIVKLANVLDWNVESVVEYLWRPLEDADEVQDDPDDFETAYAQSAKAHDEGRWDDLIRLGELAVSLAETPEQRALGWNRLVGAWDGQGQFTRALDAAQKGLDESPLPHDIRLILESNLANAYYTLWYLTEARAIAQELVSWYSSHPPSDETDRLTQAFAYFVRGNARRRQLQQNPDNMEFIATEARADLEEARRQYDDAARRMDNDSYAGIANTCLGGVIECETVLGMLTPEEALGKIEDGLQAVVDAKRHPVGDWLESYGWWCVFGCNIALRHLAERDQQTHMAILTNKAHEVAERLGNWAMWERVFTMEFARRQRLERWTGVETPEWVLDSDDLKLLVGTMGRFPSFRERGMQILESAKMVEDN